MKTTAVTITLPSWRTRGAAAGVALAALLSGCGLSSFTSGVGGGVLGGSGNQPQKVQSVTPEQMLMAAKSESTGGISDGDISHGCPRFATWPRDHTLTVYEAGRVGDGLAVMHRGEITKTARECDVSSARVTVKYGFSGRILMGPKGKDGTIRLPITIFVTDAKRERVVTERMTVEATVAIDKPVGYFSSVKTISFTVPEGARAGEFEVFVAFERNVPNSG